MSPASKKTTKDSNAANLGFEAKLFGAADTLRNYMDAALGGFVLANGSMSSSQSGEAEIRTARRIGRQQ